MILYYSTTGAGDRKDANAATAPVGAAGLYRSCGSRLTHCRRTLVTPFQHRSRQVPAVVCAPMPRAHLAALLVFTGLMQYLSNEIAFCTLSVIHPVTYAVANTLKRSIAPSWL